MNTRYISLASAALLALSAGVVGTAAADDQDDEVRALNVQALENARGDDGVGPTKPDSIGGPEFSAPPTPDEGMTDEDDADDEAAPPPDADADMPE